MQGRSTRAACRFFGQMMRSASNGRPRHGLHGSSGRSWSDARFLDGGSRGLWRRRGRRRFVATRQITPPGRGPSCAVDDEGRDLSAGRGPQPAGVFRSPDFKTKPGICRASIPRRGPVPTNRRKSGASRSRSLSRRLRKLIGSGGV